MRCNDDVLLYSSCGNDVLLCYFLEVLVEVLVVEVTYVSNWYQQERFHGGTYYTMFSIFLVFSIFGYHINYYSVVFFIRQIKLFLLIVAEYKTEINKNNKILDDIMFLASVKH